jgi:hypothetical protein
MSTITLSLITTPATGVSVTLGVTSYVHKRIEKFIYTDSVKGEAVPISYLENQSFDAWQNLQIVDRSYSVPANSDKRSGRRAAYRVVESASVSSQYRTIQATNKTYINERGHTKPLFFRHDLPADTVQCELYILQNGNRHDVDTGYILDLDNDIIYTNYKNFFNPDTGAYKIFGLVCTDSEGVAVHTLLNPKPVAREADWQDIDLDTGLLTTDYPVYSRERNSSGYTFYFSTGSVWYIKPVDKSLIKALRPSGKEAGDPWFLRFSNGDLTTVVNDSARRYFVPEYDAQPFIPSKPTSYSPYKNMLFVNKSMIAATRDNLNIDPDAGLHLNIIIKDPDGILIRALTTDQSLAGARFSDSDVFYEADKIDSWDNQGGFVALGMELHASWSLEATYYYTADDFEYNLISLNPLNNKQAFNHTFIFYAVPDVNANDRGIHHLVVDHGGTIIECSQGQGISHPNLQLHSSSGVYNANTVIGLKYTSEIETDTFMTRYTAGFENNYGYMVVAECAALDISLIEDQFEVDVRRAGYSIVPAVFKDVIRNNPKILQSSLGYDEKGQEVPENSVMILKAPATLLADYGGKLSQDEAEGLLKLHMTSAGYALIDWVYPVVELTGSNLVSSQIDLTWTWEGPDLTYRLYRRASDADEWILIDTQVSPVEGTISYTDLAVAIDEIWHYEVRVFDDVEFPAGHSLSVKVR